MESVAPINRILIYGHEFFGLLLGYDATECLKIKDNHTNFLDILKKNPVDIPFQTFPKNDATEFFKDISKNGICLEREPQP